MLRFATVLGALLLGAAPAAAMSLTFAWSARDRCATSSPAFQLSALPSGTARIELRMIDLNVPTYDHGGGAVAVSPQGGRASVAAGAFSYRGPCPPSGQHRYRWTARALDAQGRSLGTASATRAFPP
jgi:hypothetical protein